jgi:hypothetical protein
MKKAGSMRIEHVASEYNRQKWDSRERGRKRRPVAGRPLHPGVIDMIDLSPQLLQHGTVGWLAAYIYCMPEELVKEKSAVLFARFSTREDLLAFKVMLEIL